MDIFGDAASLHIGPPARLFRLASGELSLTIVTSNIVGEYRRVFYNYPGPKNEDNLKNEDVFKNEDNIKNENDIKK